MSKHHVLAVAALGTAAGVLLTSPTAEAWWGDSWDGGNWYDRYYDYGPGYRGGPYGWGGPWGGGPWGYGNPYGWGGYGYPYGGWGYPGAYGYPYGIPAQSNKKPPPLPQ